MQLAYSDFIATICETAQVPDEEAERSACATLETLGERLSIGESEGLAERLPEELRNCMQRSADTDGRRMHADEFVQKVAERVGLDDDEAERDARAVFAALARAVGPDEFSDLRSELPHDFEPLFGEAVEILEWWPAVEPDDTEDVTVSLAQFLAPLDRRTHVDRDAAMRIADMVLYEIATRLSGGEVIDLERHLPPELRTPLERGRHETGGRGRRLSLQTFLSEIAKREGVDRGRAAEHARAIFDGLRNALQHREWSDLLAELPVEFRPLLARG